ncbi:MAG: uncharacterized protein conserved in archaea [Haloquadratum sp. J07HQX50]|nr:MAG: uncharacterized protein conserved in archaea [Haloquadratum sp. J07HQX50]
MIGIVESRADIASTTIGEALRAQTEWETIIDDTRPSDAGGGRVYRHGSFELRQFDSLHLRLENVATVFSSTPEFIIFLSRHSGETGPLLTAHFTGNFGNADYGGDPRSFAPACPNAQRVVFKTLQDAAPEEYDVGIECTHHGPTRVDVPSLFVELGSSEAEWTDTDGASAVATAVLELSSTPPIRERQLIGFGGGHYAPRFERILTRTDWAVGHIGADWCLDALGNPRANQDVLGRAIKCSDADYALVTGTHPTLERTLEDMSIRVVGERWLTASTGVDLSVIEALEAQLCPISDGLRLGERIDSWPPARPETDISPELEIEALSEELLDEVVGIDRETARGAINANVLAFTTEQGGSVPARAIAVESATAVNSIRSEFIEILRQKYETVESDGEIITATRDVFDPDAASTVGVPEGPAFGKLAAGESVDIDGTQIDPAVVHRSETVSFHVQSGS